MVAYPCGCPSGEDCLACSGGKAPSSLSVTIAGVVPKLPQAAACVGLCDLLNDTFVLDWEGVFTPSPWYQCRYRYSTSFYDEGLGKNISVGVTVYLSKNTSTGVYSVQGNAFISSESGGWVATCAYGQWELEIGTDPPNCSAFAALSLTHTSDVGNSCVTTAATFAVTSL